MMILFQREEGEEFNFVSESEDAFGTTDEAGGDIEFQQVLWLFVKQLVNQIF